METLRILLLVGVFLDKTFATFNFYMNGDEVKRILGITKELYYVREGVPNTYALNFVVPIQPNVTFLRFTWESLGQIRGCPYSIRTTSSDPLTTPTSLSIPPSGTIPTHPTTFQVFIPCSGLKSTQVLVEIAINVTMITHLGFGEITKILLGRKKICLEGVKDPEYFPKQTSKRQKTHKTHQIKNVTTSITNEQLSSPEPGLIFLVLGSAFAVLAAFGLVLGVAFMMSRNKKLNYGTSTTTTTNTTKSSSSTSSLQYDKQDEHLYSSVVGIPTMGDYVNCQSYTDDGDYAMVFNPPVKTIERHQVRLETLLQEGTYSRIYKASLDDYSTTKPVLVKTLSDTTPPTLIQSLLALQSSLILSNLNHKNLSSLVAITNVEKTPPYLIYELDDSQWWNLKTFLMELDSLEGLDLIQMGLDVAEGLNFIHGIGLVHGHVSARCCGITLQKSSKFTVKLTDASLAKDLFPEDYCSQNGRPIRWLAPESIVQPRWTTSGDVWSLGVLLWELVTSAKRQPYSTILSSTTTNVVATDLFSYLHVGYRLEQPEDCGDDLYLIIVDDCWAWEPEDRGSSASVLMALQTVNRGGCRRIVL